MLQCNLRCEGLSIRQTEPPWTESEPLFVIVLKSGKIFKMELNHKHPYLWRRECSSHGSGLAIVQMGFYKLHTWMVLPSTPFRMHLPLLHTSWSLLHLSHFPPWGPQQKPSSCCCLYLRCPASPRTVIKEKPLLPCKAVSDIVTMTENRLKQYTFTKRWSQCTLGTLLSFFREIFQAPNLIWNHVRGESCPGMLVWT